MSVGFYTTNQALNSVSQFLIPATSMTVCLWARVVNPVTFGNQTIFYMVDGSGENINFSLNSSPQVSFAPPSPGAAVNIVNAGSGSWYFYAFTVDAARLFTVYWSDAGGANGNLNSLGAGTSGTATTYQDMSIGDRGGGDIWNGDLDAVKIWADILTPDELRSEMFLARPQRTNKLIHWFPLLHPDTCHMDHGPRNTAMTRGAGTPLKCNSGPPITWS